MKHFSKVKKLSFLVLALTLCGVMFLTSCAGMNRGFSTKKDDQGVFYCPNQDKKGYSFSLGNDTDGDIIIPETFKDKPVKIIENDVLLEEFLFTGRHISIPDTIERIGCSGAYWTVEQYIKQNGIETIQDDLGPYAVYDNGSVYMGNEENPYLILVYTDNINYTSPEGTKIIAECAFSEYTESIKLSDDIVYVDLGAFRGIRYEVTTQDAEGNYVDEKIITKVAVDAENDVYTAENNNLYNKDKTRLIYKSMDFDPIPDSVEYVERYAICEYNWSNLVDMAKAAGATEDEAIYLSSVSNPNFMVIYCPEGAELNSNTEIIGICSMQAFNSLELPDSVRQILPCAFDMDKLTSLKVNTEGWYSAIHYADGYGYELGLNYYVSSSKYVYAKMGDTKNLERDWSDPAVAADEASSPYYDSGYDWRRAD